MRKYRLHLPKVLHADGDAAAVASLGHRLKGNGASYGFPEITAIGAQIEELGHTGQLDAIRPLIAQLRRIHNKFQTGLQPPVLP